MGFVIAKGLNHFFFCFAVIVVLGGVSHGFIMASVILHMFSSDLSSRAFPSWLHPDVRDFRARFDVICVLGRFWRDFLRGFRDSNFVCVICFMLGRSLVPCVI